jgi:hypothetical protein
MNTIKLRLESIFKTLPKHAYSFHTQEWVRFRRSQLRLVRPPKKTVENYGEALY